MSGRLDRTYAQARAEVLARAAALPAAEVALEQALGRALRQRITARHALPSFRNSAMDGYAVRAADTAAAAPEAPLALPVSQVIAAGHAPEAPLAPGTAARIMTGAMLPEGADAIVPFEEAERGAPGAGERVVLRAPAGLGAHIRDAGADIAEDAEVLAEGAEVTAHAIGLLGALGEPVLRVGPSPRVALFSTGDELLSLEAPLAPGAVRDSNLGMLSALCREAGAEVLLAERLPDAPRLLSHRLSEALGSAHVTLTIGGVSVGDFDPVQQVVRDLPGIALWQVAMRPGRPQAFGAPAPGRLFFGLPGNPASVACVFEALVRPALRSLQGFARLDRPRVPVRMAEAVASKRGRTDFLRCRLAWSEGRLTASLAGAQVSGHQVPQARAHALVVVPEEADGLARDQAAEALLLRWPGGEAPA